MKFFEKTAKTLFRNLPLIMGIAILSMDFFAFLAPVFAHLELELPATIIYKIYSFLCHQRPWRSIHLWDYQVAWCTRDVFIYLSMGLAGIFVHFFKIRGIKWYVALLAVIPFALDGIIQLIAEINGMMNGQETFFYASTNFQRMLTGAVFGAAAGLWLFGMLAETIDEEVSYIEEKKANSKQQITNNNKFRNTKFFLIIIATCLASYLLLVQAWSATSFKYKPDGILDHKRYFPGVNYELEENGKHVI